MLKGKHIASLLLVLFIFMGSTGVYVFSHYCEVDGAETSLFVKSDHCQEVKPDVPACCQVEKTQENKDCCGDEVEVIQVSFDYFQDFEKAVLPVVQFEASKPFVFLSSFFHKEKKTIINGVNAPPILSGTDILVAHQVFRL
jgi:hypothetical protein